MDISQAHRCINQARETIKNGDHVIKTLAYLMVGRLRVVKIPGYVLAELKRELRDFNMQTHEWKDKK